MCTTMFRFIPFTKQEAYMSQFAAIYSTPRLSRIDPHNATSKRQSKSPKRQLIIECTVS